MKCVSISRPIWFINILSSLFHRFCITDLLMTAKNTYLSSRNKVWFSPHNCPLAMIHKRSFFIYFHVLWECGANCFLILKMMTFYPNPSGGRSGVSSVKDHLMNQQNIPTVHSLGYLILTSTLKSPCKFLPPLTCFLSTVWHTHKENFLLSAGKF